MSTEKTSRDEREEHRRSFMNMPMTKEMRAYLTLEFFKKTLYRFSGINTNLLTIEREDLDVLSRISRLCYCFSSNLQGPQVDQKSEFEPYPKDGYPDLFAKFDLLLMSSVFIQKPVLEIGCAIPALIYADVCKTKPWIETVHRSKKSVMMAGLVGSKSGILLDVLFFSDAFLPPSKRFMSEKDIVCFKMPDENILNLMYDEQKRKALDNAGLS